MLIRRIRDQAVRHNWFGVAIDVAIVIVGVFLGLQANNWNAARAERAEAREYRSEIVSDLRANEADIIARSAFYGQVRAHALAALQALEDPHSQLGESFLVDAYLAADTNRRPLVRSAYDEMVDSGIGRDSVGLATRSNLRARKMTNQRLTQRSLKPRKAGDIGCRISSATRSNLKLTSRR